jgi:hypothetical protein
MTNSGSSAAAPTVHSKQHIMDLIITYITTHGDMGHVALLVWAGAASGFAVLLLRALNLANTRFDTFVRELARFNRRNRRHADELAQSNTDRQNFQHQKREDNQASKQKRPERPKSHHRGVRGHSQKT